MKARSSAMICDSCLKDRQCIDFSGEDAGSFCAECIVAFARRDEVREALLSDGAIEAAAWTLCDENDVPDDLSRDQARDALRAVLNAFNARTDSGTDETSQPDAPSVPDQLERLSGEDIARLELIRDHDGNDLSENDKALLTRLAER